jgi:hypothetical protein
MIKNIIKVDKLYFNSYKMLFFFQIIIFFDIFIIRNIDEKNNKKNNIAKGIVFKLK